MTLLDTLVLNTEKFSCHVFFPFFTFLTLFLPVFPNSCPLQSPSSPFNQTCYFPSQPQQEFLMIILAKLRWRILGKVSQLV